MVHDNKNKQPGIQKKVRAAKLQFASTLDQMQKAIGSLHTAQGEATPDQVSDIITEKVIPALEGVKNTLTAVDEALPTTDDGMDAIGGDLGESEEIEDDDNQVPEGNDDEEKRIASLIENHPKFKDMVAKLASMHTENILMKKASLAQRYASQFPPNMRSAMEKEFLDEHKEDEDLGKMEAKVASLEKGINAYKTAGLINKSRAPVSLTAKDNAEKLRTAKNGQMESQVPWHARF